MATDPASGLEQILSLKEWIMTGSVGIVVFGLINEVRRLRESVEKINVGLAGIASAQDYDEDRFTEFQRRLERIENLHVKPV